MKCDLHVHTVHSGMCTVPVARAFCRECYNQPYAVYEKLMRAGMDLVTVTDHDSIEAASELQRFPNFFLSVEATCHMPSGTEVHLGVYDVTERQHMAIQERRSDYFRLIAYLQEQKLFYSVNHLLSSLTGRREMEDYELFHLTVPCYETVNGAMLRCSNERAGELARLMKKTAIGGSDAHTMSGVGRAFTVVPGARSKAEYFAGLRNGASVAEGQGGSFMRLTADVLRICRSMMEEHNWTYLLAPLAAGVPLVILVNYLLETRFAGHWFERIVGSRSLDALSVLEVEGVSSGKVAV